MRILVGLLALLLPLASQAGATSLAEAATQLDGHWQGEDAMLKIDAKRAQASLDPAKPFEWQRFLIKEVSGQTVVFTVGSDLFEARIGLQALTLTGTTFRGERLLERRPPAGSEPSLTSGLGMRSTLEPD